MPVGSLDVGSEPELVRRLAHEIRSNGPIPFARFMERALYEPGLGYYRRSRPGPGRAGDFLTAPETHPIFGRLVGRQLTEAWERMGRPEPFVVHEPGAGEGALAAAVLDGLERDRSGLLEVVRWVPVEVDDARVRAFQLRLEAAGHAARLGGGDTGPITGAVVANEVLDALPVHRVTWHRGQLRERHVDWGDGGFVEVLGPPSSPALAARLAEEEVSLVEGQQAEICLAIEPWLAETTAPLARGLVLLIDYGHPAAELYGPRRRAGTLAAYVGHRVHADPYRNVGRQDLTAHVDLTAVEHAAAAVGLDHLGTTTQAEFLMGLGIEELLREAQAATETTLQEALELRAAVGRLLDPSATGRFRVLLFGRELPRDPPLRGLTFRLPSAGRATDRRRSGEARSGRVE
jgi:SAM-dependent MidA family methyltransferase